MVHTGKRRADYGSPSRLAPAAPSERGRLFVRGKGDINVQCIRSTSARTSAHPNPKRHSRLKSAPAAKAAAAKHGRINAPARDTGRAPTPNPSGTANLKSAPAAKPPQQHPVGNTHRRETKAMQQAQTQTAQPTSKASRRQSRRSNTRQDKRAHARQRA